MAPPFKHHVKTSPYLELENPFTVVYVPIRACFLGMPVCNPL